MSGAKADKTKAAFASPAVAFHTAGPAAPVDGAPATIAVQLAARIAQRIIEGDYPPGSNLREIPLADAFQVGRSSVR